MMAPHLAPVAGLGGGCKGGAGCTSFGQPLRTSLGQPLRASLGWPLGTSIGWPLPWPTAM